MSTPSKIGLILPDGRIKRINSAFNGFITMPHGNGYILSTFYRTNDKVEQLLDLGDINVLGILPRATTQHQWGNLSPANYCELSIMNEPAKILNEEQFRLETEGSPVFSVTGFVYLFLSGIWYCKRPSNSHYFPIHFIMIDRFDELR